MKNPILLAICFLFLLNISACKNEKQETNRLEYSKYITGFTQGTIRSTDAIVIRLNDDISFHADSINTPLSEILRLSPNCPGSVSIKNSNTLEFIPNEPFRNGETYRVNLCLDKITSVPRDLKEFSFDVNILPLTFSFKEGSLHTVPGKDGIFCYTGTLQNSDLTSNEIVEKLLTATLDGKNIPIEWKHDTYNHQFTINDIERSSSSRSLQLTFDDKVSNTGTFSITVPPLNEFYAIEATVSNDDASSLNIVFSDNIDAMQDLTGLVNIEGVKKTDFNIQGNIIRVYLPADNDLQGKADIRVCRGIANEAGDKTQEDQVFSVNLPSTRPEARFVGDGTFTPAEGDIIIPISTVGLRAIQLHVVKIFDNNMQFYLQEGAYDQSYAYEMRRSGRTILNKRIDLVKPGQQIDLSKWQDFTINLEDYISVEKGVIYQLELRFRKAYTTWADASDASRGESDNENAIPEEETEYFDGIGYSYNAYPENYNWAERDNPASDSYYINSRFPKRNIVVTSLGVTAKGGSDGKYMIAVNDLQTTEAVKGCKIIFYNYQRQELDSTVTDKDGLAFIKLKSKPFTLMACKGNDKTYLKINDASSLSFSNFDISGQMVQQGIKGFLYGERGVWRPGDNIYLSFMLEDEENLIPEGHPIIAELYDPNGNIVETLRTGRGKHGLYCFTFKTNPQAMTGYWRAIVRVGSRHFTKTLRIETVKPNRLSIETAIPDGAIGKGSAEENIPVATRWLHGAQTSSLKAITELRLTKGTTSFEKYPGYVFDDQSRTFNATESTIFEGTTDKEGRFNIPVKNIVAENAPGMLNARLTTRVFEPGGDFSTTTSSIKYSPYSEYVGIKLPATEDNWYNANQKIHVSGVVVTTKGNPVGKRRIQIDIYRLEWRWWWDAEQENLSYYVNRAYQKPLKTYSVQSSTNGQFEIDLNFNEWGRYFIIARDEASGHTCGTTMYVSSWDNDMNIPGMSTLLNLTTDKKNYKAGESVQVRFPSSEGGIALVSIEDGKSVKDVFRIPTKAGHTTFKFAATQEMCPNIYVNVSLIQPQKDRDNDKPIRLYGVINVPVEDPALQLTPVIKADKEVRPSQNFSVSVSEKNGRPMTYSIAVVDEGLLSLTSFKTPDPFTAFYAREALGVKTWDFYDDVCGAYGGRLENAFAIGGDEAIDLEEEHENNRFTPVVIFDGPFTINGNERHSHTFRMPEYIGEVRIMVVAEHDGRYGSAAQKMKVNKPLMLNVTMPRLFTPGDEIEIPITVFALKENIRDVTISMQTDDKIEVLSPQGTKIQFTEKGEQVAFLKARVKDQIGNSTLTFMAQSGNETAHYTCDVEIRMPNPRVTQVTKREIAAGETFTFSEAIKGLQPQATLEISSIPALNLEQRLNDLIQYPHGCGEQITSAAFPQLVIGKLMELSQGARTTAEINVKETISRLREYQNANGGFCYWPASNTVDEWVTTYIADFLIQAERQGYSVPSGMKNGVLSYLSEKANKWNPSDYYAEIEQAYRLYVLALAGKSNLAAMNRLREIKYRNPIARWQLASAYALLRHTNIARELVANLPAEAEQYRQLGRCYGSTLRDNAIILRSLIDIGMQDEAYKLLQKIASRFASGEWLSTQECAFGLCAVGQYVDTYLQEGTGINILVDGKTVSTAKTILQQEIPTPGNKMAVSVKNNGQTELHARVISSAIPIGVTNIREMNGLQMNVNYYRNGMLDNAAIYKQGEDIMVEITIRNTGNIGRYDQLALTYLFPSGFEYLNERLTSGENPFKNADNADIRDDRACLYFSLEQSQQKTFRFRFNAAYPGKYLLPAINCAAMYDNSITATLPGREIEIKRE